MPLSKTESTIENDDSRYESHINYSPYVFLLISS